MRLGKYEDLVHVTKFHTSVKTSPSLSSLIFSWVKRTENECVVTRYRCNGIIFFFIIIVLSMKKSLLCVLFVSSAKSFFTWKTNLTFSNGTSDFECCHHPVIALYRLTGLRICWIKWSWKYSKWSSIEEALGCETESFVSFIRSVLGIVWRV